MEFSSFTIVFVIVIILIVRFSLRQRYPNPARQINALVVLTLLAMISMALGKYGAGWGLPWWIYYLFPLLLTLLFPVLWFRMKRKETFTYLLLTLAAAPFVHIIFSLMGWKDYMPFIEVPSLLELMPKV